MVMCTAVLLAAGVAACRGESRTQTESEPPLPVVAEAVQLGDIHGTVSATGVVSALPGADFVASSDGPARIVEISAKPGDHVKSGDALVRFELPSLRAESAARAATVKSAEIRFQRAKLIQTRIHSLLDRGAASQKEIDDADREVSEAESEVTQARASQSATISSVFCLIFSVSSSVVSEWRSATIA